MNICREPHAREQSGRALLPVLAAGLLAVALVLRVALPLWPGAGPDAVDGRAGTEPGQGGALTAPDLAALQSLSLFDSAAPAAANVASPALNTSLNLHLEGVILGTNGGDSRAVILSGDRRGSYRSGDTLPAGANVRLDSIARDHVVIDNRGQREVLWLFAGGDRSAPATAGVRTPQLTLPAGTDARMVRTAARLAEIITVTPEPYNGALLGYRLAPGARLKEFVNLGFEEGDIVTAVNGIALNDVANLPKLYSLMDGASEVSFSLLRKGTPLSLKVTLTPEISTR
jgi:general secretion pathway protein C